MIFIVAYDFDLFVMKIVIKVLARIVECRNVELSLKFLFIWCSKFFKMHIPNP